MTDVLARNQEAAAINKVPSRFGLSPLPDAASIQFTVPGEPTAFARAGANGKRRFTLTKQANFMGVVKQFAADAMAERPPIEGPIMMVLDAIYIVPKSWPAKRAKSEMWKTSKPDADNIAKLVKDAVKSIVWIDDAQVAQMIVSKRYGPIAEMRVTITSLA